MLFCIGYSCVCVFPFSDPVITDNPKKMAWHSRKPEEEKQLLESLTKENRIGCLIEKKPDGKTHHYSSITSIYL